MDLLFFYLLFGMPILLLLRVFGIIPIPYWVIVVPAVIPAVAITNLVFVLLLLSIV